MGKIPLERFEGFFMSIKTVTVQVPWGNQGTASYFWSCDNIPVCVRFSNGLKPVVDFDFRCFVLEGSEGQRQQLSWLTLSLEHTYSLFAVYSEDYTTQL